MKAVKINVFGGFAFLNLNLPKPFLSFKPYDAIRDVRAAFLVLILLKPDKINLFKWYE